MDLLIYLPLQLNPIATVTISAAGLYGGAVI